MATPLDALTQSCERKKTGLDESTALVLLCALFCVEPTGSYVLIPSEVPIGDEWNQFEGAPTYIVPSGPPIRHLPGLASKFLLFSVSKHLSFRRYGLNYL
jgi:hypothetical protein